MKIQEKQPNLIDSQDTTEKVPTVTYTRTTQPPPLAISSSEHPLWKNTYFKLGLVLLFFGIVFTPLAFFIMDSAVLAATGITTIITGFICLTLIDTHSGISQETSSLIWQTSIENMRVFLDEIGIYRIQVIYFPSTMCNGRQRSLIPLDSASDQHFFINRRITGGLIVRFGAETEAIGITIATPGVILLRQLEATLEGNATAIESAVNYLLSGVLNMSGKVSIGIADSKVIADVPVIRWQSSQEWYQSCTGSIAASVVAAVSSEALGRPVRIINEQQRGKRNRVVIEILP